MARGAKLCVARRMHQRLQPYALDAAAVCIGGCDCTHQVRHKSRVVELMAQLDAAHLAERRARQEGARRLVAERERGTAWLRTSLRSAGKGVNPKLIEAQQRWVEGRLDQRARALPSRLRALCLEVPRHSRYTLGSTRRAARDLLTA